jgi:hypothetical protein
MFIIPCSIFCGSIFFILDPSILARRLFYPPVLWRGGGPNPSNQSNLFENELHSFPSTKSEIIHLCYRGYAFGFHPPTGGRLLGGGGFFMPTLKCSPVALRFQRTRCTIGCFSLIAPFSHSGHSMEQHPQYQHSSG